MPKKSLTETHPEVAKQWYFNNEITPNDIRSTSIKKFWWKCQKGDDHIFQARVADMTRNDRRKKTCPICSGRMAVISNSLKTLEPKLSEEWHQSLNDELSPINVTCVSSKRVWWKCPKGEDHVWKAMIKDRVNGAGCSICSNLKIVKSNSLQTLNPKLAKEWHPTKNGNLTPSEVGEGSAKKVWWKCSEGEDHEWKAMVLSRKSGRNCPICANLKIVKSNSLQTLNPKLAKEWHPTKNGNLTPSEVGEGSAKKVWWKCSEGEDHEWNAQIASRNKGIGCSICANLKIVKSNSLQTLNPKLAKEWHPTKNKDLTPHKVGPNTHKKVWWKCPKGDDHEYLMAVSNRTNGQNCTVCSGKKVVSSSSLLINYPKIASQWHPTKNGKLKPLNITSKSSKMVWWKCSAAGDHEWKTKPLTRVTNNSSCPFCTNQRLTTSNSLAKINPKLAKEWHPTKNGNLTPLDITSGAIKKVWWKCPKGEDHEWKAMVLSRKSGRNCPICTNLKIVKSNSLQTLNPKLAKEWHPTKNGNLTPSEVGEGSAKKVWWKCSKGEDHEWKAMVLSRKSGRNCPFCSLTPQSKQELTITFELMKLFKNIDPKGLKAKLGGRLRAIDIFIPKLNLCIEFDGSYWHKDKRDIDKIKSEMLFEEGFKLIRVREEPLEKLYDTDVISKQPYNGKQVTNDILSMIMSIFELDAKLVSKIKEYQSKEGLQNEKGLDRYIDKILTGKAEKK